MSLSRLRQLKNDIALKHAMYSKPFTGRSSERREMKDLSQNQLVNPKLPAPERDLCAHYSIANTYKANVLWDGAFGRYAAQLHQI